MAIINTNLGRVKGLSAYEVWAQTHTGTEEEYLASLKGDAFKYEDFTPEQLEGLKGPKGDTYTITEADYEAIAEKVDVPEYTAGDNITIENDVISAKDTTYEAGDNITIENNVISATDTTYEGSDYIDIDDNVISINQDTIDEIDEAYNNSTITGEEIVFSTETFTKSELVVSMANIECQNVDILYEEGDHEANMNFNGVDNGCGFGILYSSDGTTLTFTVEDYHPFTAFSITKNSDDTYTINMTMKSEDDLDDDFKWLANIDNWVQFDMSVFTGDNQGVASYVLSNCMTREEVQNNYYTKSQVDDLIGGLENGTY